MGYLKEGKLRLHWRDMESFQLRRWRIAIINLLAAFFHGTDDFILSKILQFSLLNARKDHDTSLFNAYRTFVSNFSFIMRASLSLKVFIRRLIDLFDWCSRKKFTSSFRSHDDHSIFDVSLRLDTHLWKVRWNWRWYGRIIDFGHVFVSTACDACHHGLYWYRCESQIPWLCWHPGSSFNGNKACYCVLLCLQNDLN